MSTLARPAATPAHPETVQDTLRAGASTAASAGSTSHWLWSAHVTAAAETIDALHNELAETRARHEAALSDAREAREALRSAQADVAAAAALRASADAADAARAALLRTLQEADALRAQLARSQDEAAVLRDALQQADTDLASIARLEASVVHAAEREAALRLQLSTAKAELAEESARARDAAAEAKRARRAGAAAAAAALRCARAQQALVDDCCALLDAAGGTQSAAPSAAAPSERLPTPEEAAALRLLLARLPALRGAPREHVQAVASGARVLPLPSGAPVPHVASACMLPASGVLAELTPDGAAVARIAVGGELDDDALLAALSRAPPPLAPRVAITDCALHALDAHALDALWLAHPAGLAAARRRAPLAAVELSIATRIGGGGSFPPAGTQRELQRGRAAVAATHAGLLRGAAASLAPPPAVFDLAPAMPPAPRQSAASAHVARIDELLARLDGVSSGAAPRTSQ